MSTSDYFSCKHGKSAWRDIFSRHVDVFLTRVETRGIIEAKYSEPVTETRVNHQRKSI